MLRANKADREKLEEILMMDMLHLFEATIGGVAIMVNSRELFAYCQFSNLKRIHFQEEVQDCLLSLPENLGTWTYAEFGDGEAIFTKLDTEKYSGASMRRKMGNAKGVSFGRMVVYQFNSPLKD